MCLPDPVERLEAWEDEMSHEYVFPDGRFKCCGCGKPIEEGKCRQVGIVPYQLPACEACFVEAYQDED